MPKKVLFVDRDSNTRQYYCQCLRQAGFEVFESDNGKAAFSTILSRNPDLVISEVMLPVLNGFDLLQKIRQRPSIANLPVILITDLSGEIETAKKLGVTEYLLKPDTHPTELVDKVKSLIGD